MNPKDTRILIERAGGNKSFAEYLGIESHPRYQQRVNRWKQRGIPARFYLDHQTAIRRLARKHGIRIVLTP